MGSGWKGAQIRQLTTTLPSSSNANIGHRPKEGEGRTYLQLFGTLQPSGCNLSIYSQFAARLDSSRFAATSRPRCTFWRLGFYLPPQRSNCRRKEVKISENKREIIGSRRLNHKQTPLCSIRLGQVDRIEPLPHAENATRYFRCAFTYLFSSSISTQSRRVPDQAP